jgi:hypothetical protein
VIAFPPFHAGAVTFAVNVVFPEIRAVNVGASGLVYGIAVFVLDGAELPAVFSTTTWTVYEFPFVSPDISYDACPIGPKYEYMALPFKL